ncbi:MAG: hypothetical protein ACYTEQ_00900 [Planctomycetota bacterium]|jgi:hypothetical protein
MRKVVCERAKFCTDEDCQHIDPHEPEFVDLGFDCDGIEADCSFAGCKVRCEAADSPESSTPDGGNNHAK